MTQSAVSPLALPSLRAAYRRAVARRRLGGFCREAFAPDVADLRAQIRAAVSGAPSWTDSAGAVWGPGRVLVGGVAPAPGIWFGGAGF